MVALLDELEPEFGSGKVFRPYRDVRFSKDKTHQGGFVEACPGVGFYVQIDASGLFVAGGYYSHTPEQLVRYRAAVDDDDRRGRALQRVVRTLGKAGYDIGGDRLRTRPRGADPAHPRLDLLRHRTLTAGAHLGCPDWLDSDEAADRVRDGWRAMRPLVDWFAGVFV